MGQAKQRRKEIEALIERSLQRKEKIDRICNQPLNLTKSIYEIGEQLTGVDTNTLKLMSEYTGNEPKLVTKLDQIDSKYEILRCYQNAKKYIEENGGRLVKGWQGWTDVYFCKEHKEAYLQSLAGVMEWNQHAVVELPSGKLIDPTPPLLVDNHGIHQIDTRKTHGIFWEDVRLRTTNAMSYTRMNNSEEPIGWGTNAIYIPTYSDWYAKRSNNEDLINVEKGILTSLKGSWSFSQERLAFVKYNETNIKIKELAQ